MALSSTYVHGVRDVCETFVVVAQVFKVQGEDLQIYAVKEVYMKNLNDIVKKAYMNEIKLLNRLRDKPEIITLYD